jgi:hypothetical protein
MDAIPARRFSLANASSDSMKLWRFLGIIMGGCVHIRQESTKIHIPGVHVLVHIRKA